MTNLIILKSEYAAVMANKAATAKDYRNAVKAHKCAKTRYRNLCGAQYVPLGGFDKAITLIKKADKRKRALENKINSIHRQIKSVQKAIKNMVNFALFKSEHDKKEAQFFSTENLGFKICVNSDFDFSMIDDHLNCQFKEKLQGATMRAMHNKTPKEDLLTLCQALHMVNAALTKRIEHFESLTNCHDLVNNMIMAYKGDRELVRLDMVNIETYLINN